LSKVIGLSGPDGKVWFLEAQKHAQELLDRRILRKGPPALVELSVIGSDSDLK
jgi:hypothetical protein